MYQVPCVTCRDQIGAYRTDCYTGPEVVAVALPGTVNIPVWMLLAAAFFVLLASHKRGA